MNNFQVYIDGIGLISRCAQSPEEVRNLIGQTAPAIQPVPLEFACSIPPAKLRRTSRYSKMACAAADAALKDCADYESADRHRIGTIISTGYGAAQYSSEFAESVVKGNPSACSPSVFSGSVPNSCVGQICIINGLKGPSTVLAGGDPLEYASLLLNTDRADLILAGSVEEYYPPLYRSVSSFEAAKGCDLSEGAAMLMLRGKQTDHTYCRVSSFAGACLGKNPYLHMQEGTQEILEDVLSKTETPDLILTAENGTWFDEPERKALQQVFPASQTMAPKKLFGETLGCGYMMNIAMAAVLLRYADYGSILAAGTDMIGNYCCALLKKV